MSYYVDGASANRHGWTITDVDAQAAVVHKGKTYNVATAERKVRTSSKGLFVLSIISTFGLNLLHREGKAKLAEIKSGKSVSRIYCESFNGAKFRYQNMNIYEGEFLEGLPHGNGVLHYVDGRCYMGQFKAGVPHGEGTMRETNGDTFHAIFSRGY